MVGTGAAPADSAGNGSSCDLVLMYIYSTTENSLHHPATQLKPLMLQGQQQCMLLMLENGQKGGATWLCAKPLGLNISKGQWHRQGAHRNGYILQHLQLLRPPECIGSPDVPVTSALFNLHHLPTHAAQKTQPHTVDTHAPPAITTTGCSVVGALYIWVPGIRRQAVWSCAYHSAVRETPPAADQRRWASGCDALNTTPAQPPRRPYDGCTPGGCCS
jgi:hypothetical protein